MLGAIGEIVTSKKNDVDEQGLADVSLSFVGGTLSRLFLGGHRQICIWFVNSHGF